MSVALSELVFLSFVTASVKPIVGLVRILGGGCEGLSLERGRADPQRQEEQHVLGTDTQVLRLQEVHGLRDPEPHSSGEGMHSSW